MMLRKFIAALALSALAALAAAGPVLADPNGEPNWGQEVKGCNASHCYPGGTSRGAYVNEQARDGDGPGYGREIHDLAKPGASDPSLP